MKKYLKSLFAGALVFAFAAGACGSSDHSEDLSQLTPEELCQRKCDLQVSANCQKMPAEFATSCVLLCQAKYDKFPNCAAQSHALDACGIQRVSYGCEEGVISTKPVGACASEGLSCASCAGSFTECL